MLIDAHHHLWRLDAEGFEWPTPDLAEIHRDFAISDLRQAAKDHGLTGTVLVQSQPCDADTQWLLEVAAQESLVRGVVGWTDLSSPEGGAKVNDLAQNRWLKGLRPMLQNVADDAWILRADVARGLEAMIKAGLALDALIFTRHLPALDELATRYPELRIVIDHGAKPPMAARSGDPEATAAWFDAIARVARHANIHCKLSGLLTELAPGQPIEDVKPYMAHLLDVFGPSRLIFGSDWPVINLRGAWKTWHDLVAAQVQALPSHDRQAIWGGNAVTFYGL